MKYQGNFRNNMYFGIGEKFDLAGNYLCKCNSENSQIESFFLNHAQMKASFDILALDDKTTYIGETANKIPHGFGTSWNRAICQKQYEGMWHKGLYNGFGKWFYKNTNDHAVPGFLGVFENSKRNGRGILFYHTGKILCRGHFTNSKYDSNRFHMIYKENGEIELDRLMMIGKNKNTQEVTDDDMGDYPQGESDGEYESDDGD
jgi:hypothetical protein